MALSRITAASIADGTVVAADIADGSITTAKIADGNVTAAKVSTIANTQLTGTITATQLAANSVNASILQTNSVENYMATSGRPLSNRNLVINGAMQVAQRNTSVTGITTEGYYTADRWQITFSSAGTWTMNVDSSGPTGTEFRNSANLICTTADSSLSAADFFIFRQFIEGQNLQGIKKGTANAESLTLSFWVKSSNTGTYICEFVDADNIRQISKSYTIDASNTWEKKTITFPPDTTGQFDNDNAVSLRLHFWLAAGSDRTSGTLNSSAWASTVDANRAVGQLNLANATGNYWAVTGIQLETGTVATPYEWMDYGTELVKCQRYYYFLVSGTNKGFMNGCAVNSSQVRGHVQFPITMRTTPSLIQTSGTNYYQFDAATTIYVNDFATTYGSDTGILLYRAGVSPTAGQGGSWFTVNASAYLAFSAEL